MTALANSFRLREETHKDAVFVRPIRQAAPNSNEGNSEAVRTQTPNSSLDVEAHEKFHRISMTVRRPGLLACLLACVQSCCPALNRVSCYSLFESACSCEHYSPFQASFQNCIAVANADAGRAL